MSSAQSSAVAGTSQGASAPQQVSTGEVVRFPGKNNGNHIDFPLTTEAYDCYYQNVNVYTDPSGRSQRETRRHFLPLPAVRDIVSALGRQMTKEDMDYLVGLDGDPVGDHVTGRRFQPVWWVLIKPRLLGAIAHYKAINPDVLRAGNAIVVGQYFPHPDQSKAEHIPVAGVPYFWKKDTEFEFARWSNLWKIHEMNGNRWGATLERSNEILAVRKAREEAAQRQHEELNHLADLFKTAGTQRRDRRQFRPKLG